MRSDQRVQCADRLCPCLQLGSQGAVGVHRRRVEGQYFERREELLECSPVSRRSALGNAEGQLGTGDAGHCDVTVAQAFEMGTDIRRAPIDDVDAD